MNQVSGSVDQSDAGSGWGVQSEYSEQEEGEDGSEGVEESKGEEE